MYTIRLFLYWPYIRLFWDGVAVNHVPSMQGVHGRVASVLHMMCGEVQNDEHKHVHGPEIDDDKTEKNKKWEISLEYINL